MKKTLFKLGAILFLLNISNIGASLLFLIYKWCGLFEINNYFIEDLLLFSVCMMFPIIGVLLGTINTKNT